MFFLHRQKLYNISSSNACSTTTPKKNTWAKPVGNLPVQLKLLVIYICVFLRYCRADNRVLRYNRFSHFCWLLNRFVIHRYAYIYLMIMPLVCYLIWHQNRQIALCHASALKISQPVQLISRRAFIRRMNA